MPAPQDVHRRATRALSVAMVAIGIAMVTTTVVRGGGPLATGVLLGLLFAAAGAARLHLERGRG